MTDEFRLISSVADEGFADAPGTDWMSTGINIALHLFLIGAFALFVYALYRLVREPVDSAVRFGRYMALFIGALIVVGSQAVGTSYTEFIIDSLGDSRSVAFRMFGAVMPATAGLVLGIYLTRGIKKANERAMRVLLIVGTFCVTQFALMYAVAVDDTEGDLGAAVTPNVAFVAGLGLILVLNLGVNSPADEGSGSGIRGLVDRVVGRAGRQDSKLVPDTPKSEFLKD